MQPAAYWRFQQQEKKRLGQKGQIVSLTQHEPGVWQGIIQLDKERVVGSILSYYKQPLVGDEVVGVLRILEKDGKAGLIQYGVKYLLQEK